MLLVQEGRYQEALGLGDTEQAARDLHQTRELMQRTGCWRMKDWLAEAEELLEYSS